MLFAIKRSTLASLALLLALLAGSLPFSTIDLGRARPIAALLVLVVLIAFDVVLDRSLRWTMGERYRARYAALGELMAGQPPQAIIIGALLAGSEELLLRGVLLGALVAPLGPWPAVLVSAAATALAYLIPTRPLWPFSAWSFAHGVALGWAALLGGSVLPAAQARAAQQFVLFALLALQRRPPWLTGPE